MSFQIYSAIFDLISQSMNYFVKALYAPLPVSEIISASHSGGRAKSL